MNVGIGLPVAAPEQLLTWARRADAGPFRTIALLDRVVYDNPEPLIALAALAGVTTRVRLQTEVLLAPLHRTVVLAKQAATLDRLSGGRFTLGIGVGGRADDFDAARVDLKTRGRRLDEQMQRMRGYWSGTEVGPVPTTPGGPEVLFGGFAPAAVERVARWGDGFLGAAAPPAAMGEKFAAVVDAWERHGRSGSPRLVAQFNAVLGSADVIASARAEIGRYYAFAPFVDHIVNGLVTTPEQVRSTISAFGSVGADEVMLYCYAPDPDQLDRIGDAITGR
ncbi:LLM class flavin-dependent oxidoreductase [Pseudonocardia sp. GCM10023141]|uniref:LLM class flavin-dependent oxidoreductase n=1 Tax=Pseudonocardia sp. GCM10023141 TaxID=3252653 RepID=UPI0036068391